MKPAVPFIAISVSRFMLALLTVAGGVFTQYACVWVFTEYIIGHRIVQVSVDYFL